MAIDFKAATDTLFAKTGAEELAGELGCSPQAIKQARMDNSKPGHRTAPPGWEVAAARLARQKAIQLQKLADRLGVGMALLSKRTVVILIIAIGISGGFTLANIGHAPIYPPTSQVTAAGMVFWGSVSAAISAARTPGGWGEKITRVGVRSEVMPRWVWPLFIVILAIANYLVAIAVVLGAVLFAPGQRHHLIP